MSTNFSKGNSFILVDLENSCKQILGLFGAVLHYFVFAFLNCFPVTEIFSLFAQIQPFLFEIIVKRIHF